MKSIKIILFLLFISFLGIPVFAQSFYRPWSSYTPVKPQKPYEYLETLSGNLVKKTCYYNKQYYEPNEFFTKNLDINSPETFAAFKNCCSLHPSRCASHYVGTNNKTLLYTMVEHRAYDYMDWILTDGLVYETNVDEWGLYIKNKESNAFIPIQSYTPMMLACIRGDLTAAQILRKNGAYISQPVNAIGLTAYDYIGKYKRSNPDFFNYIDTEYQEECKNITDKKQFGKTFSMNEMLKEFIDSLEKNFFENQQKIIDKISEINRA